MILPWIYHDSTYLNLGLYVVSCCFKDGFPLFELEDEETFNAIKKIHEARRMAI